MSMKILAVIDIRSLGSIIPFFSIKHLNTHTQKKKKIGKTESKAIDVFSEILMMMIALCSINISIDISIANTQNYVALGI